MGVRKRHVPNATGREGRPKKRKPKQRLPKRPLFLEHGGETTRQIERAELPRKPDQISTRNTAVKIKGTGKE